MSGSTFGSFLTTLFGGLGGGKLVGTWDYAVIISIAFIMRSSSIPRSFLSKLSSAMPKKASASNSSSGSGTSLNPRRPV